MYASLTHVYFEMENDKKGKFVGDSLIKWDYKMGYIQGVAIGNTWVAVACQDTVRLFDLFGNELSAICHDRMFISMAVYEDILAGGYNAAIPLI